MRRQFRVRVQGEGVSLPVDVGGACKQGLSRADRETGTVPAAAAPCLFLEPVSEPAHGVVRACYRGEQLHMDGAMS